MAIVDAHREVDQQTGATVHEVHQLVCTARVRHCAHHRARAAHGRRRRPHVPLSRYRAAMVPRATPDAPGTRSQGTGRQRRAVLTVLACTTALAVLYLWALWVLEPDTNDGPALLGVYLIGIGGAVCLNAITIEAMNPAHANPRRPTPPARL